MMLRTATRRCHGPLTHLKGLLKALPVTQRFVSTQEVASSSPSLFTAEIPQSLMVVSPQNPVLRRAGPLTCF